MTVLLAALGIGLLIFVHEFGHFVCARLAGVRVEVFSLGFGQRLCGFEWRGTDYRISLVPLGGYVRVAGEDPTRRTGLAPDDLYAKGFSARALFFSGGVLANLLFALIAFPVVFHHGVQFTAPVVGRVVKGGAAWEAGLQPGDRVLRVDGKEMYSFENLQVEVALAGRDGVELEIERGAERFHVGLTPRYSERMGLFELGALPAIAPEPVAVESVDQHSPAGRAGLRAGDRILEVDGNVVDSASADEPLRDALSAPGRVLSLVVERDGRAMPISFEIDSEEAGEPKLGVGPSASRVLAVRRASSAAARLGIRAGDVVLAVDGRPLDGDELRLGAGDQPVSLTVFRGTARDELIRALDGATSDVGSVITLTAALDALERVAIADDVALGTHPELDPARIVPRPGSPAARSGLRSGDRVVAIGEREILNWNELVDAVDRAGAEPLDVVVVRAGEEHRLSVTPTRLAEPRLGFVTELSPLEHSYRVHSVGAAIRAGFVASADLIKQLYVTLKRLLTGDVAARNLGGIIQISRVSYHYAQSGWAVFVYFLALLSINLAFINVLPIPVLDGGHLLFLLIERVKGSPVSAQMLNYSQLLGLAFVIALMVYVTYNDILKLL